MLSLTPVWTIYQDPISKIKRLLFNAIKSSLWTSLCFPQHRNTTQKVKGESTSQHTNPLSRSSPTPRNEGSLAGYYFYHDNLILEHSKKLHNSLGGAAHPNGFLSLSQTFHLGQATPLHKAPMCFLPPFSFHRGAVGPVAIMTL